MERTWLIQIRKNRGWRQEDVAAEVGLSRSYYCQIENGVKTPHPDKAKALASLLGFEWTLFYP